MKAVTTIQGRGVPLKRSDVDTDQIIPAEWLKRVERTGFEKGLFSTWRDDRNFVLNDERYIGASVLVAGPSFGVGSSREHAVWAIQQGGFDAVIAPSFSDIFYDNAFKNGLLPVVLSDVDVTALANELAVAEPPTLTVDLVRCVVTAPDSREFPFCLDNGRRADLLQGLDDIGRTLTQAATIDRFQATDRGRRPWVYTRAG